MLEVGAGAQVLAVAEVGNEALPGGGTAGFAGRLLAEQSEVTTDD